MLRAVVLAARLRVHDRRADPRSDRGPPARDRAERAGAPARGVLQDPALGARRGGLPPAARDRPAQGDHARARRGAERSGRAIAALDRYRDRFAAAPDTLTNAILAGTLLQPLGPGRPRNASPPIRSSAGSSSGCCRSPRRDIERLQQIVALQPRLLDVDAPVRAQRGLLHRAILDEALTWLEIHGDRPEVVAHWRELQAQADPQPPQRPAEHRPPPARTVPAPPAATAPRQYGAPPETVTTSSRRARSRDH